MPLDTTLCSLMDGLLADGGENSCISPLSLKFALAMAYNGAEGETAGLLQRLFGESPGELNAWASACLDTASRHDGKSIGEYSPPNAELRIANSYWLRKGLESEISKSFTGALAEHFSAESGIFDKSPGPINDWVSGATNGKIEDILPRIDDAALSYLVNALYFKAQWVDDFNEELTAPGEFHNADGSTSQADMLHGFADGYIDTPEYMGMTKRLWNGFTFTAVLPKTDKQPTLESIAKAGEAADYDYTAVKLAIPKFDLGTSVNFKEGSHPEFDALFAHHGMDGALAENAINDELLISQIIHKTTFTLAEAGIEASAATIVALPAMAPPRAPKKASIVFDKPFYFTLTDRDGEVLFFGKITKL